MAHCTPKASLITVDSGRINIYLQFLSACSRAPEKKSPNQSCVETRRLEEINGRIYTGRAGQKNSRGVVTRTELQYNIRRGLASLHRGVEGECKDDPATL